MELRKKMRSILSNKALLFIVAVYAIMLVMLLGNYDTFPDEFPAPDFKLKNIMGQGMGDGMADDTVALSDYAGEPLLIYFFASW